MGRQSARIAFIGGIVEGRIADSHHAITADRGWRRIVAPKSLNPVLEQELKGISVNLFTLVGTAD